MTEASMSALARKVQAARFDSSAYPHLEDFKAHLVEMTVAALAQTGRDPKGEAGAEARMGGAAGALSAAPEGAAHYFFAGASEADVMAVSLAPALLSALSQAMLGAGFAISGETEPSSALDAELASSFMLSLAPSIEAYMRDRFSTAAGAKLHYLASESDLDDALKLFAAEAVFSVSIDLKSGEDSFPSMLAFHFPVEYLEKLGLLSQTRAKRAGGADTKWRSDMLANVRKTPVDITVVMERYVSSLSDLAKLEVGQVIPLEAGAHQSLDLILNTASGPVSLGKGRLGAYQKKKAVKLITDLEPQYSID